jgi:transposase
LDFLGHLLRHLPGRLLIIWDRLPQHRARLVREFIAAQEGRLLTEYLPSYAPELNPVEYLWGYWKQHALPNFCPDDLTELGYFGRLALRRMRRRPALVRAFGSKRICHSNIQRSIVEAAGQASHEAAAPVWGSHNRI